MKGQTSEDVNAMNEKITSTELAQKKVKEIWSSPYLYVILSSKEYDDGKSVPQIFLGKDNEKFLCIFSDYNKAEVFCGTKTCMDGHALIGRIDNHNEFTNLYVLLTTATFMGIEFIGIDVGAVDTLNMQIPAMLQWNDLPIKNISAVPLNKASRKAVLEKRFKDVEFHFVNYPMYTNMKLKNVKGTKEDIEFELEDGRFIVAKGKIVGQEFRVDTASVKWKDAMDTLEDVDFYNLTLAIDEKVMNLKIKFR